MTDQTDSFTPRFFLNNNQSFENQYLDLLGALHCKSGYDSAHREAQRNGVPTVAFNGVMITSDLTREFPAATTKKLPFKAVTAELLGFIKGYSSAADFRQLGCKIWDANANDPGLPEAPNRWLQNPYRFGHDDLGRIYGVQARDWKRPAHSISQEPVDQLRIVIEKLARGVDDRRLIVQHWNPGELDQMALAPCHMEYQFYAEDGFLDVSFRMRSVDVFLGLPFNMASYALLLHMIAAMTGYTPRYVTGYLGNTHLYLNHVDQAREQLDRDQMPCDMKVVLSDGAVTTRHRPVTRSNEFVLSALASLNWLTQVATADDFALTGYVAHPSIKAPMAV